MGRLRDRANEPKSALPALARVWVKLCASGEAQTGSDRGQLVQGGAAQARSNTSRDRAARANHLSASSDPGAAGCRLRAISKASTGIAIAYAYCASVTPMPKGNQMSGT